MRNISRFLVASTSALLLVSGTALAGNPHFIKNQTSASLSGFDLQVKFKETGLESGSVENIIITADFVGTYQCINKGKHNPNDPKKTVEGTVEQSGTFPANKNGNVTGTLTASPDDPEDVLDCPNGQTATVTAVSYSNVMIVDTTSGASLSLPGTFSAGTPVE